jgi:hypothetical protein
MDISNWLEKRDAWNKGLTKDNSVIIKKWVENNSGELSKHWKGGGSWTYHRIARKKFNLNNFNLVVHHKDGNIQNNSEDNLIVIPRNIHTSNYLKGKHNSPKTEFQKGTHPKTEFKKGHIPHNKNIHNKGGQS